MSANQFPFPIIEVHDAIVDAQNASLDAQGALYLLNLLVDGHSLHEGVHSDALSVVLATLEAKIDLISEAAKTLSRNVTLEMVIKSEGAA